MKLFLILLVLSGSVNIAGASWASHAMPHEMQHGFVLSADDQFGSHLVATGHHSRQAEIRGRLAIADPAEAAKYTHRKLLNGNGTAYFLFQAQSLDLPS